MRLVDIEKQIKVLIEEDVTNPEIYNKIYDLAAYFLRWKKAVPEYDIDGVASIVAEELYLKVYNGAEIISWIGYLSRFYHAAIRVWRKMNSSELIDATDNYELAQGVIMMSTSGSLTDTESYQKVFDNLYFDSLPLTIDSVMEASRYAEYTKEYMNARLSIVLSLCSNKFISYNLSKSEEMYTRMLYNLAKDRIVENVKDNNADDHFLSSMSLMQLFTLSNANISDNY